MTPNLGTARRLALVWGVHSVTTPDVSMPLWVMMARSPLNSQTVFFSGAPRFLPPVSTAVTSQTP